MKKILSWLVVCSLFMGIPTVVSADVHVRGHYRSDGTYVQPHYRSDPDNRTDNNWSHRGNTNPYTGKKGTKNN